MKFEWTDPHEVVVDLDGALETYNKAMTCHNYPTDELAIDNILFYSIDNNIDLIESDYCIGDIPDEVYSQMVAALKEKIGGIQITMFDK